MLDEAVLTAGDLMTRDVAVVNLEASLTAAVKLLAQRHISGMPVVDNDGNVVGMITEGDLIRWHEGYTERQARWLDMLAEGTELASEFLKGIQQQHRKVKSVMSPGVTIATEDMPARDVAHLMHTKGIKRVPVMRDGKLIGILARSDLVRALAQKLGEKAPAPTFVRKSPDEALRHGREETNPKRVTAPKPPPAPRSDRGLIG
jgi:CBS domain-containing protein